MKYLTRILMLLLVFTAAQACSELLEKPTPATDLAESVVLDNEGTVDALRAGLYASLHSGTYTTTYFLAPEAMADQTYNRAGSTRLIGQAQNSDGSHAGSWGSAYNLINKSNLIIHAIEEGVISEAKRTQYRGEAFAMRAFAMHHLVRALGYEPDAVPGTDVSVPVDFPEQNGWDHGIIVRTEPVRSVQDADFRPRQSIDQVYSQIRSDLQEAISLLGQGDEGVPTYWTQAGAYALLARVELYDRNYGAAESAAASALAATDAELATEAQVATMFDETAGLNPEAIFVVQVQTNSESIGVNSALSAYTSKQWVAQVPTQSLMDLHDANDARLAWYAECDPSSESGCLATHPGVGAEPVKAMKWGDERGSYRDDAPFFRVSEMLLIQTEARLNDPTLGAAIAPINELRAERGLTPLAAVDTEAILDERRREFALEGHRFWDLKRLGRTIVKDPTIAAAVNAVEDVQYGEYIILDNLPNDEVVLSEENAEPENVLLQNPGYE